MDTSADEPEWLEESIVEVGDKLDEKEEEVKKTMLENATAESRSYVIQATLIGGRFYTGPAIRKIRID